MKAALLLLACLALGCPEHLSTIAPQGRRMGVASAYRVNGVVTLSFFGNAHGLHVGDAFALEDAYGVAEDRPLFPHGNKRVASVPATDVLTYAESGPDVSAAGGLSIRIE